MKYAVVSIVTLSLFASAALISIAGTDGKSAPAAAKDCARVDWEVPIAAGTYYPSDGEVPDHPVRYYRVRCWPGCHVGSSYGMFPDIALETKPIYPTSTIDLMSAHGSAAAKE
jgi:hypothetical protein